MAGTAGIAKCNCRKAGGMSTERHLERTVLVATEPARLFAALDDPARFGAHMSKPSAAMLGGTMRYELDAAAGQAVGSIIRMTGNVLGLTLSVSETFIERMPPVRKVWETTGSPRLLILAWYRMGFDITLEGAGSRLTVFSDYRLPERMALATISRALGPACARCCLSRIVTDAGSVSRAVAG